MSYFSFEEAFEALKSLHKGETIKETQAPTRTYLRSNYGIDYETFSKLYEIGNRKYLLYDVYLDAIVRTFNILEIY
jgi:hypothetical protein